MQQNSAEYASQMRGALWLCVSGGCRGETYV